jgi:AAA ATPase-like protein
MFAGREDELDALDRLLEQAKGGNAHHFLLTGERGIGKSSLLLYLRIFATRSDPPAPDDQFNFVVLDIELDPNCTYTQIIRQLALELRKRLEPYDSVKDKLRAVWEVVKNIEAAGVRYTTTEHVREDFELLEDLVSALSAATTTLGDSIDGILILIDEADKAPTGARLGAFLKLFTERLTKRGCDSVCVGLAGVTGIVQQLRASHESAPRVFTTFSLKTLEPAERRSVVERGLTISNQKNSTPTTITDGALEAIANLSEGYPHFVQQFAYSAFEEDKDNSIDEADVSGGATRENGALDQLGEKYFQEMFFERINSNEYRAVLKAMAQSADPDGWCSKERIRQLTGLKETTLGNAIYTLKDREIILPKPGEKGVYRLPTQSFGAWIRARWP